MACQLSSIICEATVYKWQYKYNPRGIAKTTPSSSVFAIFSSGKLIFLLPCHIYHVSQSGRGGSGIARSPIVIGSPAKRHKEDFTVTHLEADYFYFQLLNFIRTQLDRLVPPSEDIRAGGICRGLGIRSGRFSLE